MCMYDDYISLKPIYIKPLCYPQMILMIPKIFNSGTGPIEQNRAVRHQVHKWHTLPISHLSLAFIYTWTWIVLLREKINNSKKAGPQGYCMQVAERLANSEYILAIHFTKSLFNLLNYTQGHFNHESENA